MAFAVVSVWVRSVLDRWRPTTSIGHIRCNWLNGTTTDAWEEVRVQVDEPFTAPIEFLDHDDRDLSRRSFHVKRPILDPGMLRSECSLSPGVCIDTGLWQFCTQVGPYVASSMVLLGDAKVRDRRKSRREVGGVTLSGIAPSTALALPPGYYRIVAQQPPGLSLAGEGEVQSP